MLDSSTDLGKRPNVWFNGPRALGSAVLAVVTKTKNRCYDRLAVRWPRARPTGYAERQRVSPSGGVRQNDATEPGADTSRRVTETQLSDLNSSKEIKR